MMRENDITTVHVNTTSRFRPLVVVGVDGSRPSVAALNHARQTAEASHARLRAVAVWSYPVSYTLVPLGWSPREDAAKHLAEASREVFGDTFPDWYEQVVKEGSPAHVLITESADAELLIVGNRGRGGFAGLLLGSVSSQCAGHTLCPVIVVHDDATPLADKTSIVVGHDGSQNADEALGWALQAAQLWSAPVEVVRTWGVDRTTSHPDEETADTTTLDEVTSGVRRDLIADIRGIVDTYPGVAVDIRAALAQPAEELIARSAHARMLVLGSRGRGGFAGLILGSVSRQCTAHARCPVMVVPNTSQAALDLEEQRTGHGE